MKQVVHLVSILLFAISIASAQESTKNDFIISLKGEKLEGVIKEQFKSGKLAFISADNKKKTYSPSDLKSFSVNGKHYLAYSNDFYEEIISGEKASLYKKVTDNSGQVLFNGSEAIGLAATTEGKKGAYYLMPQPGPKLDLVTEKNFKDYFIKLVYNNDSLVAKIKDGTLGYPEIKAVVVLCND